MAGIDDLAGSLSIMGGQSSVFGNATKGDKIIHLARVVDNEDRSNMGRIQASIIDFNNANGEEQPGKDKNITKLGMVWGVLVYIDGVEAFPTQRRGGVWMSIDDLFEKIEKAFETDEFLMWEEKYATETSYQKWGTITIGQVLCVMANIAWVASNCRNST